MSCGAVMSPVVLMNSGVGPKVYIYTLYTYIYGVGKVSECNLPVSQSVNQVTIHASEQIDD